MTLNKYYNNTSQIRHDYHISFYKYYILLYKNVQLSLSVRFPRIPSLSKMLMWNIHVECSCRMFVWNVHVECSRGMYMFVLNVHVECSSEMEMYMIMWNVKKHEIKMR